MITKPITLISALTIAASILSGCISSSNGEKVVASTTKSPSVGNNGTATHKAPAIAATKIAANTPRITLRPVIRHDRKSDDVDCEDYDRGLSFVLADRELPTQLKISRSRNKVDLISTYDEYPDGAGGTKRLLSLKHLKPYAVIAAGNEKNIRALFLYFPKGDYAQRVATIGALAELGKPVSITRENYPEYGFQDGVVSVPGILHPGTKAFGQFLLENGWPVEEITVGTYFRKMNSKRRTMPKGYEVDKAMDDEVVISSIQEPRVPLVFAIDFNRNLRAPLRIGELPEDIV